MDFRNALTMSGYSTISCFANAQLKVQVTEKFCQKFKQEKTWNGNKKHDLIMQTLLRKFKQRPAAIT